VKFWVNRPETVRIRWYRVPRGTPALPIPTVFSSSIWHYEPGLDDPEDGEAGELYQQTRWDDGVPWIDRPPPTHFCGRPEAWMGATWGVDLPLSFTSLGWGWCCGINLPPVHVRQAGIRIGGITPIPARRARIGFGRRLHVNTALALFGLQVPRTGIDLGTPPLPSGEAVALSNRILADSGTADTISEGSDLPMDPTPGEVLAEGSDWPIDPAPGDVLTEGDG
jgi:hypothetical protein